MRERDGESAVDQIAVLDFFLPFCFLRIGCAEYEGLERSFSSFHPPRFRPPRPRLLIPPLINWVDKEDGKCINVWKCTFCSLDSTTPQCNKANIPSPHPTIADVDFWIHFIAEESSGAFFSES